MKKFFIMLAISILAPIVSITNASALTEDEETLYNNFNNNYYDNNYPYCFWSVTNKEFKCFANSQDFRINNKTSGYYYNTFKRIVFSSFTSSEPYVNDIITKSSTGSFDAYSLDYANFNIYNKNLDLIKFEKNIEFGSTIQLYTITFNPPKNTTLVVKDSNGVEVTATSQYVYELSSGTYTYSASNSLYSDLTDIEFTVLEDKTIDVNMQEKLQSQPMKSIFTQYYNYISDLVGKVFDIENPMLLFFVSFIIGFSLIILIKKLIGGIF